MKNSKNKIIAVLCIAICIMTVGYAAFSTVLNVTGTANVTSTWKVVFTKIEQIDSKGTVEEKAAPVAEGTSATFNVGLNSPGDYVVYQITVANQGTLDAIIDDIKVSETGSDALTFEVSDVNIGDTLSKGASTTFKVKISYKDVTSQPSVTENKLTVLVNYAQNLGANGGGSSASVVFNKENPSDLTLTSQEDISTFKEVRVDNKVVDSSNYTVTSGSTVVTLKSEYLQTLSEGIHTMDIVSTTSTKTTTFEISTTKSSTSLVEKILSNNEVYADNVASKYVSSNTGINFGVGSSDTNGKGLYYTSTKTEGNKPTYYFRGDVDNNYVQFGSTAQTCSYNGSRISYFDLAAYSTGNNPVNYNPTQSQCESTTICGGKFTGLDAATCNYMVSSLILSGASVTDVTCVYNNTPVSVPLNINDTVTAAGVLPKEICESTNVCLIAADANLMGAAAQGLDIYMPFVGANNEALCENLGGIWTNEKATYVGQGVYNPYSGTATYNSNGQTALNWRIVRINEDGSVRLVSKTPVAAASFNTKDDDNAYVGYMYGTTGSSTYTATHENKNNSNAKNVLDRWYSANLSNYTNLMSTTAGFCNDRSVYSGTGIGKTATTYMSFERIKNGQPQYLCPQTSDLFTLKSSTVGNKALTYPIGLLTADEVAYSGVNKKNYEEYNTFDIEVDSYLSKLTSYYMTPGVFDNSDGANMIEQFAVVLLPTGTSDDGSHLYPVINLNSSVQITSGNGTSSNPYVVKTN